MPRSAALPAADPAAAVHQSSGAREVSLIAAALFLLGLGEELWQAYLPAYLAALGAGGVAVGLFSSARDLLDSLYQYPGGWLADRIGRRRALLLFTALAGGGYLLYAVAPSWPWMFAGLLGVMAWKAGAFPTTFAVIGDALPPGGRGVAFAVQSTLVRIPRIVAAPLGGLVIASAGIAAGMPRLFGATVLLAAAVLLVLHVTFRDRPRAPEARPAAGAGEVWREMPRPLKDLLAAELLVRFGEGVAASFIVLHVLRHPAGTPLFYGGLYALQQAVSIASYLPGGRIADVAGRRPLVALTFLFFGAFPLAVRVATTRAGLAAAFLVGGLKEFGEPARKSLIVDLAPPERRAATVGVYYAIRNLVVAPAGFLGGLLWVWAPSLPLEVASALSLAGCLLFVGRRPPSVVGRESDVPRLRTGRTGRGP